MSRIATIQAQVFLIQAARSPHTTTAFWACPEGMPNEVSAASGRTRSLTQYGLGAWKTSFKIEFTELLIAKPKPIRKPSRASRHQSSAGAMKR